MNGRHFIQSLESRTLFNATLPPTDDPGNEASAPAVQMEHAAQPGGGSPDGIGSGSSSGGTSFGASQDARRRFVSTLVQID